MKLLRTFVTFAIVNVLVSAMPQIRCRTYLQREVICTHVDNYNIILRRGMAPDTVNTTNIILRRCNIVDLEDAVFLYDDNLKYIDLSENSIWRLNLGVLNGSQQVTHLNLSHNLLTTFPLGIFEKKPNLELLDLKGNKLNFLPKGLFDQFQKLAYLDLSSNNLLGRDMEPGLFKNCRKIKWMDLSSNNMHDSPGNLLQGLESIEFLNLDRCSLNEIPSFVTTPDLKTMKHLRLYRNLVRHIDHAGTFGKFENLEILNLSHNDIRDLAEDVFKPLKKLKSLNFHNNRLLTIPDSLFLNLKSLEDVDFSYNIITHVPLNAFRGTSIKKLNMAHNKFTYLEANFCLELRNFGVRLNTFYFNNNPWQCACLNDILNEMKYYGIAYNSLEYNGAYTVCVTTQHFTCKRQMSENHFFKSMYYDKRG